MLIPWIDSVRSTKKLTVFNGITAAKWATVFSPALVSFNKLNLGITAEQAKNKDAANVVVFSSERGASYTHGKIEHSSDFDGSRFHGYTMLFHPEGLLEKAVVFLPADPKVSGGFIRGKEVFDRANPNQMRVIFVHEMIHACGLDNGEHDDDGLFQKSLIPVGSKIGSLMPSKDSRPMPPMYLSQATKSKIIQNWN
jgi:hypothetical protein